MNDYATAENHFARTVAFTLIKQYIIMEMLVKHLCLVHHSDFKRNSAHLQDDYGSHGSHIILAMVAKYFLSKQAFILHCWTEKKENRWK